MSIFALIASIQYVQQITVN